MYSRGDWVFCFGMGVLFGLVLGVMIWSIINPGDNLCGRSEIGDNMANNKFMTCSTCFGVFLINNTGTCLACQKGFMGIPQEDSWGHSREKTEATLAEQSEVLQRALKHKSPKIKRRMSERWKDDAI